MCDGGMGVALGGCCSEIGRAVQCVGEQRSPSFNQIMWSVLWLLEDALYNVQLPLDFTCVTRFHILPAQKQASLQCCCV